MTYYVLVHVVDLLPKLPTSARKYLPKDPEAMTHLTQAHAGVKRASTKHNVRLWMEARRGYNFNRTAVTHSQLQPQR